VTAYYKLDLPEKSSEVKFTFLERKESFSCMFYTSSIAYERTDRNSGSEPRFEIQSKNKEESEINISRASADPRVLSITSANKQ